MTETNAEKIIRLTREKEASDLRLAILTSQTATIELRIKQLEEETEKGDFTSN